MERYVYNSCLMDRSYVVLKFLYHEKAANINIWSNSFLFEGELEQG